MQKTASFLFLYAIKMNKIVKDVQKNRTEIGRNTQKDKTLYNFWKRVAVCKIIVYNNTR